MSEFLWGVYPYLCAGLFFVVPVLRMVYRPYGWSTRASGIFGRRVLGAASLLLHWGLVLLFLGHLAGFVGGLLGLGAWIGFFYWAGLVGGVAVLLGSSVALVRRMVDPEVRAMSQHDDYLVHLFLIVLVGLGLYQVLVLRIFGNAYPAAAWFASLWELSPQPELMASATPVIQIHVLVALTFLAYFPFTKLVHFWAYPLNYMVRPYQAMRTLGRRFQGGWELGLRTDRNVMLLGMGLLLATFVALVTLTGEPEAPEGAPPADAAAAAGLEAGPRGTTTAGPGGRGGRLLGYPLYVSQCARCHALEGAGDGPGAGSPTFATRPRDLTAGRYRCVTTENAVASSRDLRRSIREGLPGSGMPGFGALSEAQVASLVDVLLWMWNDRSGPTARVEAPPRPEPDGALLERGRELYASLCAQCHGQEGRGDGLGDAGLEDWRGLTVRPANLAAGEVKCGSEPEDLYRRVVLGVPGGAGGSQLMPGYSQLAPEEVWAVVTYLERELLPGDAEGNRSRGDEGPPPTASRSRP